MRPLDETPLMAAGIAMLAEVAVIVALILAVAAWSSA